MPVMDEVQLPLASEPGKTLKPGSFYVVFLVEKDVCVERRCTRQHDDQEEIEWQDEGDACSGHKRRNEEEGRIVAFVTEVGRREEMVFGVVGVVEVYVIAEEP